ncbi:MAG: hypothetical protein LBV30_00255, partial [Propionibacteriaceae bacterium]|nr:hypothetical protein [Propionibacteriaceae bacterium]
DAVIVAPGTWAADRVEAINRYHQGQVQLFCQVGPSQATIGPLVIPGDGPCLNCHDLTRRDLDPTWPLQVYQLSRCPSHANPELSLWAASLIVCQLHAWAAGSTPDLTGAMTIMTSAGQVRRLRLLRHPDCRQHDRFDPGLR